ncbi:lipase family protein [Algoriphagus sp.]|uniref:lipase family protein n=1 Tax=Algoriphagus sp. TaxID=1872435 RepID=UPI002602D7DF|nr:lipase family protein [Algoriphagus sp.]
MIKVLTFLGTLFILSIYPTFGQLQPGFIQEEYLEILGVFTQGLPDSLQGSIPRPVNFTKAYESPTVGLENKWALWIDEEKKQALVAIRGTIQHPTSWLANFYAAMIPAKGRIKIREDYNFDYNFSEHPQAGVHAGWALATGSLAETILPKIDSLITQGYMDFIVTGHSQGGAITYLVNMMLQQMKKQGRWQSDIRIKSYASAAPKPGNLFFAYDYEQTNSGGWAFNVVNTADWVPQVPFSIQTTEDFSQTNPFGNIKPLIHKQKFPKNLLFKTVYNRLDKPTKRSKKNFQKYLGTFQEKQVVKVLPDFEGPGYLDSNHFSRAGDFIILVPDADYAEKFPDEEGKIFRHHMFIPYFDLFLKQFAVQTYE